MNRLYNQYIIVDADFIPVFSEHSDQEYPNKWKSFYAHDSFKTIISLLVDTLEKGNKAKDKPLWMYGAYGTGKTFASFVIKHLLEDDLSEVKAYCDANNMPVLYGKIAGIRKNKKILVVHRSSSSGIVGNNRLFNCFIESIKAALRNNGYTYMGGKSQYDNILSMLKDPNSSFNFEKAFEKYRIKFDGYINAENVVHDLEDLGVEDSVDLLENIVEVAETEHYSFSTSTADVINWIDDVIKGNGIYAIVFIWDEFTEFFRNNQNNITGLQEIAMASSRINFYPFLITHSGSQIIADQNAKKTIEARIKIQPIDLAETTAFKLMGQVIKRDPDLKSEWEKIENELWAQIERVTENTIVDKSKDTNANEFINLLPIHPYAAFLLKIISKEISSNQRTMFQFLSDDYIEGDIEKHNFRWFIDHHTKDMDCWSYLTADYLWDYFFIDDNVDLSETYKAAIAQYDNYASLFDYDESKLRVLKVSLLLSAFQQKNVSGRVQGQSSLLKATLSNISLAFVGTKIHSMISNIMATFVAKGIFSTIQDDNDILYVPPKHSIDQERFDKIHEKNKKQISFEKILSDPNCNIGEQFLPSDFLKYRYVIYHVSVHNFKDYLDVAISLPANQIPAFYLYAANEADQAKIQKTIDKMSSVLKRNFFVVDFSSTPLSDTAYEKYLYSKTEENYYGFDSNHGKIAYQNATKIIRDWKVKLNVTILSIYPRKNDQPNQVQGGANLRKKLKEFNATCFGSGLEEITINDKIFSPKGFKETVAQMAMGDIPIVSNYSYLKSISNKLEMDNVWNNSEFITVLPNHPVSKMKKRINEVVETSFEKGSMVRITDIWNALQQPPFGLMCCTGSTFLLGFLMKEFGDGSYYKYDGISTISLNYTGLSDLIFSVIKGNVKAKNQFIVKQKPEHIEFCNITGNVFKIAKDKRNSIQDIVKNINIFLKDNEYPLWSLESYISFELENNALQEQLLKAIRLYRELISNRFVAGRDATIVAEDLYRLYKENAGLDTCLEDIVYVENMKTGMSYYIASYKSDLIKVIRRLDVHEHELLAALNKKLSDDASYLWDIGDTNQQIDNLYDDYRLLDIVNGILTEKKNTYVEIIKSVKKKLSLIRVPRLLLVECRVELKDIISGLYSIKNNDLKNKKLIIEQIEKGTDNFNTFFAHQFKVFETVVQQSIDSITPDEITFLFDSIDRDTIDNSPEEFIIKLNTDLDKYRKNKKINELMVLWKKRTGTDSPNDWSRVNGICILCLFDNNYITAKNAFEYINRTQIVHNESDIDDAIAFVNSPDLDILSNLDLCAKMMIENFCGECSYIVDNVDEFKHNLSEELGPDAYSWVFNKNGIKNCIDSFVREKYESTYKVKVIEKIRLLSPEDVQQFLIELIEDKPLVGINILRK